MKNHIESFTIIGGLAIILIISIFFIIELIKYNPVIY